MRVINFCIVLCITIDYFASTEDSVLSGILSVRLRFEVFTVVKIRRVVFTVTNMYCNFVGDADMSPSSGVKVSIYTSFINHHVLPFWLLFPCMHS